MNPLNIIGMLILVCIVWYLFWVGVSRYTKRLDNKPDKKWKSCILNICDGPIVWLGVIYVFIFNREKIS